MIAVPLPTPVTFPKLTVATLLLLDDHPTGPDEPDAVSCMLIPTLMCAVFGLTARVEVWVPGSVAPEQARKAPTNVAAATTASPE
jgi:hypothetical protein